MRAVITGIGPITPIGIGVEEFVDGLTHGRNGAGRITRFDATDYAVQIAAEVADFSAEKELGVKTARRLDRYCQFAIIAARLAVDDAGYSGDELAEKRDRVAVVISSGIGGLETMEQEHTTLLERGPSRVSPFLVPMMIANMAAGNVAIDLGARGPNYTVVTACASGAHAVGEALRLIRGGYADIVITGGSEAPITPLGVAGFASMRALSTRNDDPSRASRPFDAERDGFLIAEGACVLVVESLDHALARAARIYCEVVGYGASGDAHHMTAPDPDGDGAALAMQWALDDAGVRATDIDYINAHGTSTKLNDAVETKAIRRVLGRHADDVAVSSTKSMTGHLLGAAGAVEAAACALSIHTGTIYPTINYEHPDPECSLDYVPNTARQVHVRTAMSNSLGFGGHNATLVFARAEA